jgi:hypothetical protein
VRPDRRTPPNPYLRPAELAARDWLLTESHRPHRSHTCKAEKKSHPSPLHLCGTLSVGGACGITKSSNPTPTQPKHRASHTNSPCRLLNSSTPRPSPEYATSALSCPSPVVICLTRWSQRRGEALKVNISAGEGLQDVLKSNLGPMGTIKMSVCLGRVFWALLLTLC